MNQSGKQSVAFTSFFGGLLISSVGYLFYLLNFTKLRPTAFLLYSDPTLQGLLGDLLGIISISLVSIPLGYVYRWFIPENFSVMISVITGILLWFVVFSVLNLFVDSFQSIAELDVNTNITTLCLYILYSVFLGSSFSYMKTKKTEV